jgi:hypothetical protein
MRPASDGLLGTRHTSWTARPPSIHPKWSSPAITISLPSRPGPCHSRSHAPTNCPNSASRADSAASGSSARRPSARLVVIGAPHQCGDESVQSLGDEPVAAVHRDGVRSGRGQSRTPSMAAPAGRARLGGPRRLRGEPRPWCSRRLDPGRALRRAGSCPQPPPAVAGPSPAQSLARSPPADHLGSAEAQEPISPADT